MNLIWHLKLLFLSLYLYHHRRLPASTFSSWLTDHRDQRGELPHQSLWKLLKKYGHVMLLKLTIIISSPETEKQVLRDHDLYCCSSPSDSAKKTRRLTFQFPSNIEICCNFKSWI
ncbi:hypothetical protein YC2023_079096 [Brassica napus]